MSLGGRPCALGKKREIVPAVPMHWGRRLANYARQNGGGEWAALKPGQGRRLMAKKRAQDARERRTLAAELAAAEVKQ